MCHPGVCTDAEPCAASTRLKESRERELRALTSAKVRVAMKEERVELANYRDLS